MVLYTKLHPGKLDGGNVLNH